MGINSLILDQFKDDRSLSVDEPQPPPDTVPTAKVDEYLQKEVLTDFPQWKPDRCKDILTRRDYKNILHYHHAIDFLLVYFSEYCTKYYSQVETNESLLSYPYYKSPHSALTKEDFTTARKVFALLRRIITQSTQLFGRIINPVFKIRIDVLGNPVKLVPRPSSPRPTTSAETSQQRPAVKAPTRRTEHPYSTFVQRSIYAQLPEEETVDELNLHLVLDSLRIDEVSATKELLHNTIASLSELNADQKHALHYSLVADRPLVIVNAAAAVGKTTLAARYLRLRTRKNPGEIIVVIVNSNKAATHLVSAYHQSRTEQDDPYQLLLLESTSSRTDRQEREIAHLKLSVEPEDSLDDVNARQYTLLAHMQELRRKYRVLRDSISPDNPDDILNRKQFTEKHFRLVESYVHNTERHPTATIPLRYLPEMAVAYNEATIIVGTPAMLLDFTALLKRARMP